MLKIIDIYKIPNTEFCTKTVGNINLSTMELSLYPWCLIKQVKLNEAAISRKASKFFKNLSYPSLKFGD